MSYEILKSSVSKTIIITGYVSNVMNQHIIKHIKTHPIENYIDLDDGYQTIAYSKYTLPSNCLLKITGTVIETRGEFERNGEMETKIDDSYVEYHILVDSWKTF